MLGVVLDRRMPCAVDVLVYLLILSFHDLQLSLILLCQVLGVLHLILHFEVLRVNFKHLSLILTF